MAPSKNLEQLKKYEILRNVDDVFLNSVKLVHLVHCEGYLALKTKYIAILLLTDDNVYSVGSNKWGCRGVDDKIRESDDQSIPIKVKALCQKSITDIYSGNSFIIARTAEGELYGWGYNGFGSLGLNRTTHVGIPTKIPGLKKIIDVACGYGHTLAHHEEGHVFAWGFNSHGQIGNGQTNNQLTPYKLPGLNVKCIAVGSRFSSVCTVDGKVFAWGSNAWGAVGCSIEHEIKSPRAVPISTEIRHIVAGSNHIIAVTVNNCVLTWGILNYNDTTENDINISTLPVAVKGLTAVTNVFSGRSTNIVACETAGKLMIWHSTSNRHTECPEAAECNNINDYIFQHQITGASFKISHEIELPSIESFMEAIFDSETSQNVPDVHFKFDEKVIRVHKQVLQKHCSYFRKVFDWDLPCLKGTTPIVIVADKRSLGSIRYEPFRGLLYYIYIDKINLTRFEDIIDLYTVASLFAKKRLQNDCGQLLRIQMSSETATEIYGKASTFGDQGLMESSVEFMHRARVNVGTELSSESAEEIT